MAEMKVTLSVDSEPVRAVLREAQDALSAAARDISILLAQIDGLQEATGEALEADDAALVAHIRQAWSGFSAPQEHDGPTYLDFITPDEVFDKGPDAVASWQAAKRADIMKLPPQTNMKPSREAIDEWLSANCGVGIPFKEATDKASMLHGLAYVLRQIEGTNRYMVNIGQTGPATSALRMALDHFAAAALATTEGQTDA